MSLLSQGRPIERRRRARIRQKNLPNLSWQFRRGGFPGRVRLVLAPIVQALTPVRIAKEKEAQGVVIVRGRVEDPMCLSHVEPETFAPILFLAASGRGTGSFPLAVGLGDQSCPKEEVDTVSTSVIRFDFWNLIFDFWNLLVRSSPAGNEHEHKRDGREEPGEFSQYAIWQCTNRIV